ncbi:putative membrane protein [Halobacteriovorax marinus SJ]|uniref:Membrane protein n=1 Tax=Halobacteriovorax marinus (strain ATCC BAA-682 / DSM 15412 / SJ) TaxID=862908 RepID=E1X5T2_HALMS|nr:DUF1304 domain-containing protein [Halobacteriovorax marinus]CBW25649.1 putative membrane protein [Halobacteriovorax marinus SJ]
MILTAKIFTALVALLHFFFLILEMFHWDRPLGLKVFGHKLEAARSSKVLAANQGLYNGFLSASLVYGLYKGGQIGHQFQVFFLICVVVAGVYGALTASRKIFFIQSLPALIALLLTYFYPDTVASHIKSFF